MPVSVGSVFTRDGLRKTIQGCPGRFQVFDDAVLHGNLEGIVDPVEETAKCDPQGELEDLFLTEVLLQFVENCITHVLEIVGHLDRIIAYQMIDLVKPGHLIIKQLFESLCVEALS